MDLLFFPDALTIGILSLLLCGISKLLIKKWGIPYSFGILIASLGVGVVATISSMFITIERSCGSENCFSHGWPHALYISPLAQREYTLRGVFSSPTYAVSNMIFYSAVFHLVGVVVKSSKISKKQ